MYEQRIVVRCETTAIVFHKREINNTHNEPIVLYDWYGVTSCTRDTPIYKFSVKSRDDVVKHSLWLFQLLLFDRFFFSRWSFAILNANEARSLGKNALGWNVKSWQAKSRVADVKWFGSFIKERTRVVCFFEINSFNANPSQKLRIFFWQVCDAFLKNIRLIIRIEKNSVIKTKKRPDLGRVDARCLSFLLFNFTQHWYISRGCWGNFSSYFVLHKPQY